MKERASKYPPRVGVSGQGLVRDGRDLSENFRVGEERASVCFAPIKDVTVAMVIALISRIICKL